MGHLRDSPVPTAPAARLWSRLGTKIPIWGESAKQRNCVGHSGVQPLLFVIEREGLDFSQCKKREFWLKPTLVRCFALLPVKLFMEVSVLPFGSHFLYIVGINVKKHHENSCCRL